jgi:DNA-directed RNA polymerase subunit RPC12/RpoP
VPLRLVHGCTRRNPVSQNRADQHVICPRCQTPLTYAGTKHFHEGTRAFDFLGGVFELLKHREAFDVYVCQACGRIELFLDGIGDEQRGE